MALTDFQKQVAIRLYEGRPPEAIAKSLAVELTEVLAAKEIIERHAREHATPMPANWPTGPYTDDELSSIAQSLETDVETVRATFPGAAARFGESPHS